MDREKVIRGLECCSSMNGYACAECPYSSECVSGEVEYQVGTAHLASDALALLKDQEAVEPKIDAFGHPYCPKCKILVYETWEFCPHCGQAVKWNG